MDVNELPYCQRLLVLQWQFTHHIQPFRHPKIWDKSLIAILSAQRELIVIVSPVTRREYVSIGSTATSAVYGYTNVAITWM
ncbi:hypothetical protein DIY08_01725 [Shewanella xiamenensis]|nr:hypothetical protein DIY08_01725 [Shewanella xiamenensis]